MIAHFALTTLGIFQPNVERNQKNKFLKKLSSVLSNFMFILFLKKKKQKKTEFYWKLIDLALGRVPSLLILLIEVVLVFSDAFQACWFC